jgi:hypothetical protein
MAHHFSCTRLSYLDCKRPQSLSPEERALLFRYCWDHAAAECEGCAKRYRITELASDLFGGQELLCPRCRANLIGSVRAHFYDCAMLLRRSATQSSTRVLRMQLRVGDRLTDETGEYEVIGRPYTTGGGKTAKSGASRTPRSR